MKTWFLILMNVVLVQIYAQGPSIQWQNCLGGTNIIFDSLTNCCNDNQGYDDFQKIRPTNDNGYVLIGSAGSLNYDVIGNHGFSDIWVVKLNNSGNLLWQKCIGGSSFDFGCDIQQTTDGGFILCGYTASSDGDVIGLHGNSYDILVCKISSIGSIQWTKALGGFSDDRGYGIKQTLDGGFLVVGKTQSNNNGDVVGFTQGNGVNDYDAWAVKLNTAGTIQWTKCFGNIKNDYFNSIEQLNGGGYFFCGSSASFYGAGNHGESDYWVVKSDLQGNLLWQKQFGGSLDDLNSAFRKSNTNGFLLTGHTFSFNGDVTQNNNINFDKCDVWSLNIDSLGNILWEQSHGGTLNDYGSDIIQTSDGGYAISAYTNSFNGDVSNNYGSGDGWLIKLHANSYTQWEKCFGGIDGDATHAILQTNDGGFALAGQSNSDDFNGSVFGCHTGFGTDAWVFKLGPYNELEDRDTKKISLYPNPTSSEITITSDKFTNEPYTIYDQMGRTVASGRLAGTSTTISLSNLSKGIYILKIEGAYESAIVVKE
jgi:hypothetical protein